MFKKETKKIVSAAAPLAVAMGIVLASSTAVAGKWVPSAKSKAPAMNAYGECWTAKGAKEQLIEKCGDVMPEEPAPVAAPTDGDMDNDGVPDSRDKCPNTRPGATVDADGCEIVASLTIDLVEDEFDFDSATLKPGMEAALTDLANKIKESTGKEMVTVIGHTDSTGPEDYNMGLSERRAQSAADFLGGLGITDITTKGMGESSPVADNGTREGRAKNRRVEITTK